jgi:hypothetical protein
VTNISKCSCGPKTELGKQRVSKNALKHGFFCKEICLSHCDVADFEALRKSLREQYVPKTSTQTLALERLIYCSWRLKLAARREMKQFKKGERADAERSMELPEQKPEILRRFGWGRRELADALRVMRELRQDVENSGWSHSKDWKEPLSKIFAGPEFHDVLTRLDPGNITEVLFKEHLSAHATTFKMPLPEGGLAFGTVNHEVGRVRWDSLLAIIDCKITALEDLRSFIDARGPTNMNDISIAEYSGRFFTAATRDLERAVAWYQYLREQGL